MSFRDGLLGLVGHDFHRDVQTRFGTVRVKAPMANRIEVFRKALGGEKKEIPNTAGFIVAIACYDPDTDQPTFGIQDVEELDKLPPAILQPILAAINELSDEMSLDPTTTATPIG